MDVAIRAAVLFVVLWLVIRASGKRQISQLSAFEFILLITLGDLVAQGVLEEDMSITGATIVASTFALLSVAVSWVSWRFRTTRPAIAGIPTIIIRDGKVLEHVLAYERLPVDELLEAARERGIRDLADVELAILEPDGTFSFFMEQDSSPGRTATDDGEPSGDDASGDTTGHQQIS
jgi:uncharacterized membrane protein YcaP (DUF421 family)